MRKHANKWVYFISHHWRYTLVEHVVYFSIKMTVLSFGFENSGSAAALFILLNFKHFFTLPHIKRLNI